MPRTMSRPYDREVSTRMATEGKRMREEDGGMENGKLKMEEMPEAHHPFLHAEFLHFQFFHGLELFGRRPWLFASIPQQPE
jgi:hypothetical protein